MKFIPMVQIRIQVDHNNLITLMYFYIFLNLFIFIISFINYIYELLSCNSNIMNYG